MKSKATLLNVISSLLLQVVSTISGLIVPRIILGIFGSEVNGLISSLSQFLSYITLAEGGVTGVVMAGLYKPLVDKDYDKVSSILVTAKKFYQRLGFFYVIYTLVVAVVYPLVKKTEFSFWYVAGLTVVVSIIMLIQYMFSLSLQTLLNADKKVYVVSFVQIAISVSNIILVFVISKVFPQIHLLKLVSGGMFVLQPIVYSIYVRKNYPLNWKAEEDKNLTKSRWEGFAINLAAFIHDCTDVAVLTVVLSDLTIVSVYSVYFLVIGAIKKLAVSVLGGLNPTLGQAYARGNKDEINLQIDLYEYIDFVMVFFLYTVCALLVTPFVMLYTKGVTDANYNQPIFGYLLIGAEALYILKYPHLNLAYASGRFKDIRIHAYIEAGLNIVISVMLVPKLGLIGVAIGTMVAMLYRMIFHVFFTTKLVEGRRQMIFYGKLFLFAAVTAVGIAICVIFLPIKELTVLTWIWHGVAYSAVFGILYLVISFIFFRKELKFFYGYLRKRG